MVSEAALPCSHCQGNVPPPQGDSSPKPHGFLLTANRAFQLVVGILARAEMGHQKDGDTLVVPPPPTALPHVPPTLLSQPFAGNASPLPSGLGCSQF